MTTNTNIIVSLKTDSDKLRAAYFASQCRNEGIEVLIDTTMDDGSGMGVVRCLDISQHDKFSELWKSQMRSVGELTPKAKG